MCEEEQKMRILSILLFFLVGCASVQTTGTRKIDSVIDSVILDNDKPITVEQRKEIKGTLLSARQEIITEKKRADNNEVWASRGKWCAAGLALLGLFFVFKFFH